MRQIELKIDIGKVFCPDKIAVETILHGVLS